MRKGGDDEWLSVKDAAAIVSLSEWHIKEFARKLKEENNPDVSSPTPTIRRYEYAGLSCVIYVAVGHDI